MLTLGIPGVIFWYSVIVVNLISTLKELAMSNWFVAHKEGLRQIADRLVERRGFGIVGGELYQNARKLRTKFGREFENVGYVDK